MVIVIPFHSSRGCLSYLVADQKTREALLVDPSEEIAKEDYLSRIKEEGYQLRYIIETHTHADHVSSASLIQTATGAKIVRHHAAPSQRKDIPAYDGDTLTLGELKLRIIETPGHTDESISVSAPGIIFTGDVLLIDATGRTDFQRGSSRKEYESIWQKILSLPDETIVYPAHDYKGRIQTTIKEERTMNPRLKWSEEEFITTMDNYHPELPELFEEAIAKNSI
jgi:glyoxylase-like metal-dependent hydrolase (beta-lactamase superfamily II)